MTDTPLDHDIVAPYQALEFERIGIPEAWRRYADRLTFGRGQTLAILDDGCNIDEPQWQVQLPWGPKVLATYNAFDGSDDPRPVPPGYHGTTVGYPSSLNFQGQRGVAYNNQVAHVRACSIVHLKTDESAIIARGLQWVLDHHTQYRITAINLAMLDDQPHVEAVASCLDPLLAKLRAADIWVSAPAGNNQYAGGVGWPACARDCFAISATKPDVDEIYLDRGPRTAIYVPARATSSSNAIIAGCALVLREAIEIAQYDWRQHGETLPEAMMALFCATGAPVSDAATGLAGRRLNLLAVLEHVLGR